MAKHSEVSWKQDHPSTLFGYAVQRANRAVKQAMSHPSDQVIDQAYQSISHAENAFQNAAQFNEHMDIVQQNQEQLEIMKQQLQDTEGQ
ncbi:hypothetical protein [Paenibacillus sp. FSL W7-1287]|uniref:hypothetical protein n=1 Tax=Paenibacillus sp. FSL W7-1287 TaxID=2954538 RepID=UPI0030FC847D